jgi:hypothetical protein
MIRNHITIYDYNGTMMFEKVYDDENFAIDHVPFGSGLYVVNLHTKDDVITQQVIIVE